MDSQRLLTLYRRMVLVRRLEEALGDAHAEGHIKGPLHQCDGQEAVGIGVTAVLRPPDTVTSTHRGHAHYVGMGVPLKPMVAEMMGKATGICKGRAGHMLVADVEHGLLGGNGIVGGGLPIAVGMGLAHRNQKTSGVAVCFFGDGTINSGAFNEALNMAALWRLPVVFVCENNQYGLTVHLRRHLANTKIVDRAHGYGMPGADVDGNDVEAVVAHAETAVERARAGDGPTLLVAQTYRLKGFSTSDVGGYQPSEEADEWPDPLDVTRARLYDAGVTEATLKEIATDVAQEVEAAVAYGLDSAFPEPTNDTPVREGRAASYA